MVALVDHRPLIGHVVPSEMRKPYWCIEGEEMDTRTTRKQTSASDDHRNGEDQRDGGAECDVGEVAHAVVPAFEAFLELRVGGEMGVDVGEEAEHWEVRCARVASK